MKAISGYIDPIYGASGFTSEISKTVFKGPSSWNALTYTIHTGSEHTINDKRFSLELQVYHTVPIEEAKRKEEEESTSTDSKKRNLAEDDEN
jgi:hypothetical protein